MRFAIITDIHEDVESLQEALRKIERLKVDEIACLGDISGFSAPYYNYFSTRNAHKCLSLIRENCKIVVLGNHDLHAAEIIPQNCSFFDFPENWYSLDYHDREELGGKVLWLHEENDLNPLYKENDLEYLRTLPDYSVFETPKFSIFFSHYIYPNISGMKREFYTYYDEFYQHFDFMKQYNCRFSFSGHAHSKGFFIATENRFNQYKYKRVALPEKVLCVGIPPVTRSGKRSGVVVFDTNDLTVQAIRL